MDRFVSWNFAKIWFVGFKVNFFEFMVFGIGVVGSMRKILFLLLKFSLLFEDFVIILALTSRLNGPANLFFISISEECLFELNSIHREISNLEINTKFCRVGFVKLFNKWLNHFERFEMNLSILWHFSFFAVHQQQYFKVLCPSLCFCDSIW